GRDLAYMALVWEPQPHPWIGINHSLDSIRMQVMDGLSISAALGYAFLGGVILNAMPCVFPMLGIKLMSVVKKADATKATIRMSGILYTLGVVLSFLVF